MSNTKLQDNQFHKDSINALRVQDPAIALIFGFESTLHRSLAANLLCLSGELENAIHIPKEPMLAAIRVQWWHDTIANDADEHTGNVPPLIVRLRIHISAGDIKKDDILRLIGGWQACTMDETASSTNAWSLCWHLIGSSLGDEKIANMAKKMAVLLHSKQSPDKPIIVKPDNAYFTDIRKQAKQSDQWWLYFASIIGYCRHSDSHALNDEHLLIWRLLGWRLFGFKTPN
ncbi:hypothetical protein N9X12_01620 [Alphaproteobacteria bacterium]|nr:hypothetical protein [Alphaproteobacteria bacterium]